MAVRLTNTPAANGRPAAGEPETAVLLVEHEGRHYGLELAGVTEIRAMSASAPVPGSEARAIRDRNGVRVPVYSLADPGGAQAQRRADALVVLALADRMAAVAVDAVCEVRIARERSNAAAHAGPSLAQSIGWIALWEGTEVPVLDVAAWLDVTYATALEPAVS